MSAFLCSPGRKSVSLKACWETFFLLPIFSSFPPLTNSDELVINMAATLANRAFFVNSESHVSKRSSRACHSSCPLCLNLPTLDRSAVQPRTAGACQPYVSFLTFSHFSPGCLQCPSELLGYSGFTWLC